MAHRLELTIGRITACFKYVSFVKLSFPTVYSLLLNDIKNAQSEQQKKKIRGEELSKPTRPAKSKACTIS
jgi:hypothetical protein